MHRTFLVTTCLVLVSLMLVSCGVTKRGKEMREQAYNRVDRVNAAMVHEQATTAFETGQLNKALGLVEQSMERYPKGPAHCVLRGRILMELDRLAEAERSLRQAIELDDKQAAAHYFLGIVFERLSRDDLAHELFFTASELEPDKLQFLMAAIESLMAQGRLEEADSLLTGRFSQFEHNASLHHLHGQLMVMQGKGNEASLSYEMASLLSPEDSELLAEWARLRHRQGDHSGVLACMENLRQLHQVEPTADLQLVEARSLASMGRLPESRNIYVRLIGAHPNRLSLWREFGLFAWDIQDWRSLGRCAQHLEASGDDSIQVRLFLAVSAREGGDLVSAHQILQDILEQHPEDPLANALLAGVYLRQGDSSAAKEAWQVAVKSAPTGTDGTQVTGILGNAP